MTPVTFAGCRGVLHSAIGRRGVVVCGSLGDEVLTMHRVQVFLAARLARSGFPTLRMAYYGTGDSAGEDGESDRFDAWVNSIIGAVRWLRDQCGVGPVALCGLRIGAALAARAACKVEAIDALILLAPVATGRRFLRELVIAARTTAETWRSHHAVDDGQWFEAHGLRLDRATHQSLQQLDIGELPLPSTVRVLVQEQAGGVRNRHLIEQLRAKNVSVTYEIADDLDRMLRESHESEVPHATFERAVGWLGDAGPAARSGGNPGLANAHLGILDLGACRESSVQFGVGAGLAGILAMPMLVVADAPVVVIANTGANPRWGNSRGAVSLARWLAGQGIVSLRMDGTGIGDAALTTGEQGQPYAQQGNRDLSAGVEFLATRFQRPIVVIGMCSGAYHAFHVALIDRRVIGLVLINLQKFVWHEGDSLSVMQRATFRTTRFYLRGTTSLEVWRRLLCGQINVPGIARTLTGRAVRHVAAAMDPAIAAVRGETQVGMVRRQLRDLAERSVQVLYVLSGNDPGLDEIAEYFGVRGWRLRCQRNIMFHVIEHADHTFGAQWAREDLRNSMAVYFQQCFGMAFRSVATAAKPNRPPNIDGCADHALRATARPITSVAGAWTGAAFCSRSCIRAPWTKRQATWWRLGA